MNNPFKYSFDNKRYRTWDYYSKTEFKLKVYKVPIDADFTCPNRENGNNGCLFCLGGSSSKITDYDSDLLRQFYQRKKVFEAKWQGYPYAYFQSFSNTNKPLDKLKQIYQPFIKNNDVKGIVIATRSDCLDDEKINYFNQLTQIKPIWIELGLQSIHDETLKQMHRNHTFQSVKEIVEKLANTNINVSIHLINGWPTETEEMMIQTAKEIGGWPIQAVKFHMLHILKDTPLEKLYNQKPFELLSKQQYVSIVSKQLTYLNPDIVIERLTGDGLKDVLIAPEWTLKKISVINDIDTYMATNNLYQGLNYNRKESL